MSRKRIVWKSWNAQEEDYIYSLEEELKELENELLGGDAAAGEMSMSILPSFDKGAFGLLHTPVGVYPMESMFKPSNRWDCWIATTNFDITTKVKNKLKKIDGVEALRILGRYTFFLGVPITFDFKSVRKDIETTICDYTEQEIIDDEMQVTVDLVKKQITSKKYWSILVTPNGKVDYIVSNDLDKKYLDGLNELLELKKLLGGIILRGDDG
mgnify:CR=1 FL=1|tara:strand:- start:616 stop:1251 length:636 start_codon:yes stop_codon:yes gene_type:complete